MSNVSKSSVLARGPAGFDVSLAQRQWARNFRGLGRS